MANEKAAAEMNLTELMQAQAAAQLRATALQALIDEKLNEAAAEYHARRDAKVETAAIGTHCWTPEMGQSKPDTQIESNLSHYGKHYFLATRLELSGRGVEQRSDHSDGRKRYKVTIKAYEKLEQQYSISRAAHLD